MRSTWTSRSRSPTPRSDMDLMMKSQTVKRLPWGVWSEPYSGRQHRPAHTCSVWYLPLRVRYQRRLHPPWTLPTSAWSSPSRTTTLAWNFDILGPRRRSPSLHTQMHHLHHVMTSPVREDKWWRWPTEMSPKVEKDTTTSLIGGAGSWREWREAHLQQRARQHPTLPMRFCLPLRFGDFYGNRGCPWTTSRPPSVPTHQSWLLTPRRSMTCWSEMRSKQEAVLTSALPLKFWSPKTNYFAAVHPHFGSAPNFSMPTALQNHQPHSCWLTGCGVIWPAYEVTKTLWPPRRRPHGNGRKELSDTLWRNHLAQPPRQCLQLSARLPLQPWTMRLTRSTCRWMRPTSPTPWTMSTPSTSSTPRSSPLSSASSWWLELRRPADVWRHGHVVWWQLCMLSGRLLPSKRWTPWRSWPAGRRSQRAPGQEHPSGGDADWNWKSFGRDWRGLHEHPDHPAGLQPWSTPNDHWGWTAGNLLHCWRPSLARKLPVPAQSNQWPDLWPHLVHSMPGPTWTTSRQPSTYWLDIKQNSVVAFLPFNFPLFTRVNCVPHNCMCHIVGNIIFPIWPLSAQLPPFREGISLGTSLLATCRAAPGKGSLPCCYFLHFEWQGFALGFWRYPSTIAFLWSKSH